jgi:hypothetical protein
MEKRRLQPQALELRTGLVPEIPEDCPKGPTPVLVVWLLPVLDWSTHGSSTITVPTRVHPAGALTQ